MRRTRLQVEMDDGSTLLALADGRDIRAWEARNNASFINAEMSFTLVTELAGHAAIRAGLFDGDIGEWMRRAVNVTDLGAEDDDADPTPPGPGAGQSSPSPSGPGSPSKPGKKRAAA